MNITYFPFPSGFNLVFYRYTVNKIIDDVKIEKKMGGGYETWVMIVMEENSDGYEKSVMITVLMLQWWRLLR